MPFRPVYNLLCYYLTLVFFGGFGLGLNVFCLLARILPAAARHERFFQRLIHRHFALFIWWMAFARLLRVHHHGFERLPRGGQILAANHPGLMDAPYILARVPEAVCIFKPAIRRNPVLGAAARRAGYLSSDSGIDLIRQAADKLAAGHTVLVFPEGTRTPLGETLLPLKPGFVLMAHRAQVPIQLIHIDWDTNVLVKGRAWWKCPRLPGRVDVTVGPRLATERLGRTEEVVAGIEAWFRAPAHTGIPGCPASAAMPAPIANPA
jgi:1-acyl-sn-glycerol-3-phosphate acyltransferase